MSVISIYYGGTTGAFLDNQAIPDESLQPYNQGWKNIDSPNSWARKDREDMPIWPSSALSADAGATWIFSQQDQQPWFVRWKGVHARKKISGITRDGSLNVLTGVTVKVYASANDQVVYSDSSTTPPTEETSLSDANGAYAVFVPDSASYYCVGYKTGSPDVTGATINTLTGS